ncbi:transposase [uncultured Oscillibacter sp.]|uniref:PHP domain-containing protein n=1 Tax=uncultured Oscillibacter sp. TaxID=876091 RepID=UPI00280561A9|nr:transposase [uncultured Oscillibacter sp.]
MDGYLFDPHTHTAETSKCGHLPAAEVVDRYVRHGFSGLVVTDHLHPEYLSRIDTNHDWNAVCDHYLSGYRASKQRGDEVGFRVLLGAELRFPENDNDYLVYGIDEAWLRSNPYVCCMSAREFFQKFHDQVLIIHAHPYRDGNTTVFEDAVHGTEIINGNPRHDNYNDRALELARRHPEYYRLAGSDTHEDGDEARAGVILPERPVDSFAYKALIEQHRFHLWGPEFQSFVDADEALRRNGSL